MVFDRGMAGRYDAGRRLRPADVDAWMAAARPYLPGPGGLVLDLGAGTGRFTAALARACGATVVACEPSPAMRAVCPSRPLVGGAAESLPFRAGVFDAVWASQMVHHVTDLAAFTGGVRRTLKPGGRLLLRGGFGLPDELPYYRYFPAAWPDRTEMSSLLASLDLPRVAHLKVSQVLAESPPEFVARARSRSLSNLATLDDTLFEAGLRALERDAADGGLPERVVEQLDLVVFGV
ncbi:methyltransferase domain-containing protein [Actinoplanes sp. NPDC051411]|uniref:class I SAM-dependent methyltransferase n=1 Tax=Actinoplanes sp. NPDC051411 TaxID=3155522 RepID=UPI0034261E85